MYREVFEKASCKEIGIELNFVLENMEKEERKDVLCPYRMAKSAGRKFYFGSDVYLSADLLHVKDRFELMIAALGLTETDKFNFVG